MHDDDAAVPITAEAPASDNARGPDGVAMQMHKALAEDAVPEGHVDRICDFWEVLTADDDLDNRRVAAAAQKRDRSRSERLAANFADIPCVAARCRRPF